MLTLQVLRHGHAADSPGLADADRPLSARGLTEARTVGARVRAADPQVALCSPARRARSTLQALGLTADVVIDVAPRLYLADADTLLDAVRGVDALTEGADTVLVVAHNPGLPRLVVELTGGERIPSFPPAALAVIELDVDAWWAVAPGTGRLDGLALPVS